MTFSAISHEIIGRTCCASGKWSFYAVSKFGIKNLFITLGLKIINFQDSEAYQWPYACIYMGVRRAAAAAGAGPAAAGLRALVQEVVSTRLKFFSFSYMHFSLR